MINKETCALDIEYNTCWFYLHYHSSASTLEYAYKNFQLQVEMDKRTLSKIDANVVFVMPDKKDCCIMPNEYTFVVTVGVHNFNFLSLGFSGHMQPNFVLAVDNSDIDKVVSAYTKDYIERVSAMNEQITGWKREVEIISLKTKELKPSKVFVDNKYDIEEFQQKNLYRIQVKVKVRTND